MSVYLGKQYEKAIGNVTALHGTILQLEEKVENKIH
jgi:hypothetical protein